jgi:hypothetical protein
MNDDLSRLAIVTACRGGDGRWRIARRRASFVPQAGTEPA